MSFRCQKCREARPSKEFPSEYAPQRVVTATYTSGDIAQEKNMCARCAAAHKTPTEVRPPALKD